MLIACSMGFLEKKKKSPGLIKVKEVYVVCAC